MGVFFVAKAEICGILFGSNVWKRLVSEKIMKSNIHPKYEMVTVTCGCGETFATRSTKSKIAVEICSKCHPYYTGKQKFVDTAGRVEKFQKKYNWDKTRADKAAKEAVKEAAKEAVKVAAKEAAKKEPEPGL